VEGVDSHVQLVAVVVQARMRVVEPLSSESGFKDLLTDSWICFVVLKVVVQAFEESYSPFLMVARGFLIFPSRAEVAGGSPLLVEPVVGGEMSLKERVLKRCM
jgi:hypothetical protein